MNIFVRIILILRIAELLQLNPTNPTSNWLAWLTVPCATGATVFCLPSGSPSTLVGVSEPPLASYAIAVVLNLLEEVRGCKWLRHCCCHLTARLSTTPTRLSAPLAVVMIMLTTLSRTAIAGFGTDPTHFTMQVRVTRHQAGTQRTRVSTVTRVNAHDSSWFGISLSIIGQDPTQILVIPSRSHSLCPSACLERFLLVNQI